MAHAFISYAREDRAKIADLAAALEESGVAVWMDDRLPIGSQFDSSIEAALDEASKVIVAWSPSAVDSRWVRAEAGEGLERGILVPVMVEETRIPLEFRRTQTLDFTRWDGSRDSGEFTALVTALDVSGRDGGGVPRAPSVPLPRAPRQAGAGAHPRISAEVVSASKHFGNNFRIRLRIADESFGIRHQDLMVYQRLRVNGETLAARWGLYHDHYDFAVQTADGPVPVELTLAGDGMMVLNEIIMTVSGREVLRHKPSWWDGALAAIVILITTMVLTGVALELLL